MICPNCGAENRDEARFCARCGRQLTEETGEQGDERELGVEGKEQAGGETETLAPTTESERPEPLPEGALLFQRHYEIVSFLSSSGGVNEYEAVETEPRKRCHVCRTLNSAESNFCEQCGNDLSEAELETLTVRLLEGKSPEDLEPLWSLANKGLHYKTIAFPLASFSEEPYDKRFYVALPKLEGTVLAEVEPEDIATAFAWAHLLTDALSFMEENGLSLKEPLSSAIIFTDEGEPFVKPESLSLQPADWSLVRKEFVQTVERWLKSAQGEEWVNEAMTAIEQSTNWRNISVAFQRLLETVQAPPTMKVEFTAATDVGKRREHNEDSYLTMHFERCHLDKTESLTVLAVADGMGGHAAGEVASKLCLQVFGLHLLNAIQDWLNFGEPNWHEVLKAATVEANRQVFAEAQAMRNNMGTTLTVAVLCGNKAFFANVGDSRGYLLQGGKLKQITKDHSLVQQYVDAGLITAEQARWHPQRNIITQAVGIEPTVQVDTFEVTLQKGDLVLVCSDGLVDMVEDGEIERVLLSEPDIKSAAETLIKLANEAGGDDNITVAIGRTV
ncbi:MAG: Stp1/IreP family PP2C-type Ser/Thr phosphatase [Armatimonadota bacterium]|nr:Stp1/IreP family PP2C-type Ser/Thr phosphatase [Armatimonadota bacterium]MDW8143437.1 Stp1/IreP family PP2C-type Ser/Thr phosphatase [Armatimonadota bacterium]